MFKPELNLSNNRLWIYFLHLNNELARAIFFSHEMLRTCNTVALMFAKWFIIFKSKKRNHCKSAKFHHENPSTKCNIIALFCRSCYNQDVATLSRQYKHTKICLVYTCRNWNINFVYESYTGIFTHSLKKNESIGGKIHKIFWNFTFLGSVNWLIQRN